MLNPLDADISDSLASIGFKDVQPACDETSLRLTVASGTSKAVKSVRTRSRTSPRSLKKKNVKSSAGTQNPCEHINIDYGWRERARCFPASQWLVLPQEAYGRSIDELDTGVRGFLFDSSFRSRPKAGKDYWEGFLEKVRRINSIGAPRVRVVWWRTLYDLGRIPRWPDDREHVLDLQELITTWVNKCDRDGRSDGHFMYVRFISHRWERPHFCENCASGTCKEKANPDTIDNMKARVLGAWGSERFNDVLDRRPFRPEDAYFWIDFAGISQTDPWEKIAGITALPLYVASCANGMICYVGADGQYADRAWTALERVLGYGMTASPVLMKLDEGYLSGIPTHDRKFLADFEPQWWELKGDVLHMRFREPSEGQITVKSDLEHIRKIACLAAALEPVDFYGVKLKLDFTSNLTVPVDELSRVMHHVVKRKHNNLSVYYPSDPVESEDENQEFLKAKCDEENTQSCRCRWLWRLCCRRRNLDIVQTWSKRTPVGAMKSKAKPNKDLFGQSATATQGVGIVTSRKIYLSKGVGVVADSGGVCSANTVGSHMLPDRSELVVQTQAETPRKGRQTTESKPDAKKSAETNSCEKTSWPASTSDGRLSQTDPIEISPNT